MDNSGPNKVRLDDRKYALGAAITFVVSFVILLIVGATGPEVFIRHYGDTERIFPVTATSEAVTWKGSIVNMRKENQLLWCVRASFRGVPRSCLLAKAARFSPFRHVYVWCRRATARILSGRTRWARGCRPPRRPRWRIVGGVRSASVRSRRRPYASVDGPTDDDVWLLRPPAGTVATHRRPTAN